MKEMPSYNIRIDEIHSHENRIPKHLKEMPVSELIFSFHLPFLLKSPSPIPHPVGAGDFSCSLTFTQVTRKVEYHGGYNRSEQYTVATSSLRWREDSRITLGALLREPLVAKTAFPIQVLNAMVEAYQAIQKDYATFALDPILIGHTSGEIRLQGVPEPLSFNLDYDVDKHPFRETEAHPRPVLDCAVGFLSGSPPWLSRKIYNNASRHAKMGDPQVAVIECVTCVETLSDFAIHRLSKVKPASNSKHTTIRRTTLRQRLCNVIRPQLENVGLTDATRALDPWLDTVYKLRNRIVHEGHTLPSATDTAACLNLTGTIADGIESLLASLQAPLNASGEDTA